MEYIYYFAIASTFKNPFDKPRPKACIEILKHSSRPHRALTYSISLEEVVINACLANSTNTPLCKS